MSVPPHSASAASGNPSWPVRRAMADDFPALAELWRRSVEATHDFLLPGDLERIYAEVADVYLPGVDEVWLAKEEGCPVAFWAVTERMWKCFLWNRNISGAAWARSCCGTPGTCTARSAWKSTSRMRGLWPFISAKALR